MVNVKGRGRGKGGIEEEDEESERERKRKEERSVKDRKRTSGERCQNRKESNNGSKGDDTARKARLDGREGRASCGRSKKEWLRSRKQNTLLNLRLDFKK